MADTTIEETPELYDTLFLSNIKKSTNEAEKYIEESGLPVPKCFDDKKSFAIYCSFCYLSSNSAHKTYARILKKEFFWCQDCTQEYKDKMIADGRCQLHDRNAEYGGKLFSLIDAAKYIGMSEYKLRVDASSKSPSVPYITLKHAKKYTKSDLDNYLRSRDNAK